MKKDHGGMEVKESVEKNPDMADATDFIMSKRYD